MKFNLSLRRVLLPVAGVATVWFFMSFATARESASDLKPIDLQTPLNEQAERLVRLLEKERDGQMTLELIDGLGDISRTCLLVMSAELLATERDKAKTRRPGQALEQADLFGSGYDAFATRDKKRLGLADELDLFVGAYIRLATLGVQLTEGAPPEAMQAAVASIQNDLRYQVRAFESPLIQMRAGGGEEARLYQRGLTQCKGFIKSKGTKYEKVFQGLLY